MTTLLARDQIDHPYTVNVKDAPYNAVGDGITDDTAAIQAAIDSLATLDIGGEVVLPSANYGITGLTISNEGVLLKGLSNPREHSSPGSRLTMLAGATSNGVTLSNSHIGIENLEIYGNATAGNGIHMAGAGPGVISKLNLSNVLIKGFTQSGKAGLHTEFVVDLRGDRVYVSGNDYGFTSENTTTQFFVQSSFRNNAVDGVLGNGVRGFGFTHCILEGNGSYGAHLGTNATRNETIKFNHCWFEGNKLGGAKLGVAASNVTTGVSFDTCKITANFATADVGIHIDDKARNVKVCNSVIDGYSNAITNNAGVLIGTAARGVTLEQNEYFTNTNDVTDNSGIATRRKDANREGTKIKAYLNSTHSVTNASIIKVVFDTETRDPDAEFATGTFTCVVPGYYKIYGSVGYNTTVDAKTYGAFIYKNSGVVTSNYDHAAVSAQDITASVGDTLLLVAGDTIELHTRHSETTGRNLDVGEDRTFITIDYIG